ncbi:hypothetical protein WMF20_35360 [Sorangium sp. So ce834]|uniref:hypothetical protein n=1 Tax=Sorangium sp. So ce834 TaxID=3133321 RepID=UPI003F5E8AB7
MITDLGSMTLGAALPAAVSATAAIDVACDIAAPNVSAQLDALASFTPTASLTLAAQLELAQAIVSNIQEAITLGIEPPSLDAQVAAAAAVIAQLQGMLEAVQAQAALGLALEAQLAVGGVRLLAFSGAQDTLGGELATALGPDTTSAHALVLVTTSGPAWAAMQEVFTTS